MLETEIASDDGRIRLTDAMPLGGETPRVIRQIEGLEGSVAVHVQIVLSFDCGSVRPLVRPAGGGRLLAYDGPDAVAIDSDVGLHQHQVHDR